MSKMKLQNMLIRYTFQKLHSVKRNCVANCRDRLDKKRKRELKKLREQLAQQQQLLANQNLHQSSSRGTQSDDEGVWVKNYPWKLFVKVGGVGGVIRNLNYW